MDKQDLIVNCSICDARNVTEETLASYQSLSINTGVLLSSDRSRQLFARYPITLNSATVIDWKRAEDPVISTYNGTYELKADNQPAQPTILIVNGKLTIHPMAASVLASYVKIIVNGAVYCPESLSSSLGNAEINGKLISYPDSSVLTKPVFIPNRYFHRTARKETLYFTPKLLVLLDPQLEFSALLEKQVRFSCQRVLLHDKDLELVLELLENKDTADLVILPDNGTYVEEDAVLDEAFFKKYGPSFYVNGNLTLNHDSTPLISILITPYINGSVALSAEQKDAFLATGPVYKNLKILRGQIFKDRLSVTIDRSLLSHSADGISCTDCVKVKIAPDLTPEEILNHLHFSDCVNISCTEEQKSAVISVAKDCVSIGSSLTSRTGSILGNLFGKSKEPEESSPQLPCVINTTTYVL